MSIDIRIGYTYIRVCMCTYKFISKYQSISSSVYVCLCVCRPRPLGPWACSGGGGRNGGTSGDVICIPGTRHLRGTVGARFHGGYLTTRARRRTGGEAGWWIDGWTDGGRTRGRADGRVGERTGKRTAGRTDASPNTVAERTHEAKKDISNDKSYQKYIKFIDGHIN